MEVNSEDLQAFIDQHMDMTHQSFCDKSIQGFINIDPDIESILDGNFNSTLPAISQKLKPVITDCEDCGRKSCKDRKINSKKLLTRWSHVCNICSKSIDHF
jgi:hypothetical protein